MESEEQAKQRELTIKFQMFEQQIRMLQEQLQAVEQAILELGTLNLDFDELVGKKDKEILAPIGRGIFVKAKLLSEELIVDIGNKNFVKKTIPETKKILQNQIKKLEKVKEDLNAELEKINVEITKEFTAHSSHMHHHECNCGNEECECEEDCDCEDGECECEKKGKKK